MHNLRRNLFFVAYSIVLDFKPDAVDLSDKLRPLQTKMLDGASGCKFCEQINPIEADSQ